MANETNSSSKPTASLNSGSKNASTCPHLELEVDPNEPTHFRLVFHPAPAGWVFNDQQGTREQLRQELEQTVAEALRTQRPDAPFGPAIQQHLRTQVLALLLYWVACRGLLIASGA